ncbi:MAG: heavy metal translocating P-type ATPase [Syntrophomonadaceae bacterium]
MIVRLDEQVEEITLGLPPDVSEEWKAGMQNTISTVPGVKDLILYADDNSMKIIFNPLFTSTQEIFEAAQGYEPVIEPSPAELDPEPQISVFRLEGLDCADCAAHLEKRISVLPGVSEVKVNYGAAKMQIKYEGPPERIIQAVRGMGYTARPYDAPVQEDRFSFWRSNRYARSTIISAAFLLTAALLQSLGAPALPTKIVYFMGIIAGAYLPARMGLTVLWNTYELDMNILMTLASIGAVAIGQYQEGAVVVFLFALGNTLQAYTMDKTRNSIRSLMQLSPDEALVRRNGNELNISTRDIKIDDIVIVRPGERIPMDGQVVSGSSAVDQSAITGESIPVDKNVGDHVFAGTLNTFGALEVKVNRLVSDTTLHRIIHMVEEAQAQKAPSQQFVDRFSRFYTPGVITAAILVATIPTLVLGQSFHKWFYEALGMLLVACPCALVISTPVSIVSAIGNAARNGVLIKGGAHLEESGQLSVVVFDKTGTLTVGQPIVSHVSTLEPEQEEEFIKIAAAIESRSEHPLARSIVQYCISRDYEYPAVEDFKAYGGLGARGKVEEQTYYIGSPRFMAGQGYPVNKYLISINELESEGKTVVFMATTRHILGWIAISDQLRPHVDEALASLKKAGIEKTIMLTGDNRAAAAAIAHQANIDEYRAQLLPEDKVHEVRKLIQRYKKVAMVGDGINDTPALAASTVGIAMGVAGSDAALETADITLMADDLSKLAFTIRLGRRTLQIIRQNVALSLVIKAAILLLVIPGWLTLWLAVVGDMGTSLLVTINGMRLLRKPKA